MAKRGKLLDKVAAARKKKNVTGPIPSGIRPFGEKTRSRASGRLPGSNATKRIYRRGTGALCEIRRLQRSTDLLILKLPFQKLVWEIAEDSMAGVRFQKSAMEAIQEVAEAFICHMFEEVQLCCTHAKRVTIFKKDMDLWKTLVKPFPRS